MYQTFTFNFLFKYCDSPDKTPPILYDNYVDLVKQTNLTQVNHLLTQIQIVPRNRVSCIERCLVVSKEGDFEIGDINLL